MRGPRVIQTKLARSLRSTATGAETRLWHHLRDRRLAGFKFVRQVPIGRYYVDFLCREARLVVEVDGSQHAESVADQRRDHDLKMLGFRVVRVWNNEVSRNIGGVLEMLLSELRR